MVTSPFNLSSDKDWSSWRRSMFCPKSVRAEETDKSIRTALILPNVPATHLSLSDPTHGNSLLRAGHGQLHQKATDEDELIWGGALSHYCQEYEQHSHRFIDFTKRRGVESRTLFLRLGALIQSCRRVDVLNMGGFIQDLVRGFAKSTISESVAVGGGGGRKARTFPA